MNTKADRSKPHAMRSTKPRTSVGRPRKDVGGPLGVNLFLDVALRLDNEAEWALTSNPIGAAEVAGLLLGNSGPIIEINDSEPVLLMQKADHAYALTGPGSLEFKRMMAAFSAPGSDRRAVGYYRSHIGKKFDLDEDDFRLIHACFGNTPHVILLMNRQTSGLSGARLFLEDQSSGLYELYREEDPSREIDRPNAETDDVTKNLAQADNSIPETRNAGRFSLAPHWRSFRSVSLWVVQLLVAALLGYIILKGPRRPENSQFSASTDHQTASISSQPGLALRVERQGENLRLSWDRAAPALQGAKGAELTIREQNAPAKDVLLDGDLLRTGSVLYRPVGAHVGFRLAVFGQDSGDVVGSVEAVL